jgi:hypothetical protein
MKNNDISSNYNRISLFNVPVRKIKPSDIDIYLYLDTYSSLENHTKNSNPDEGKKHFIDDEGIKIYEDLIEQGFTIFPKYADTYRYKEKGMHLYRFSKEIKHNPKNNIKYRTTKQAFRIVPSSVIDAVISDTKASYARIGDVISCTDTRTPLLGVLIRCIDLVTQKVTYKINFFADEIEKYTNNGIANQMLKDCSSDEFRQMMDSCLVSSSDRS